ncbi:MAG: FtsW/RodA/SpoVE family cell cycle protein [Anaerolineaceae bacterium]|nr:FtsW/RodA/SpoVE family cell cycle protein [Anaerolineaceae bacterium]
MSAIPHLPPILPRNRNAGASYVLLALGGVFLATNFLALNLQRGAEGLANWEHFAIWLTCAVVSAIILHFRLPKHDTLLFAITLFLSGWGILAIDRLSPAFADRQTAWLSLSTAAMVAVAIFPHTLRWLRTYRYLLLVGGLALLVSTIVLGRNPSGQIGAPQLWLGIGNIFFQPSETLKIILVAFLASYLAEQYPAMRAENLGVSHHRIPLSPRIVGPILLMWGLSVVILVWQRDLGTAMLFFIVFLALLYVASGYRRILFSGLLLIMMAGVLAYYQFDVVRLRVDIWLNPWPEADGRAYQIVQSLMAFAAGGIGGQGIDQGYPTYIPVVHSDFVFAAAAEEWGLIGVLVITASIVTLFVRGMRAAMNQQGRPFRVLLATGLSMLIAAQSLLIMAGGLKLIPLTGVTLPYMSYGGSSLLTSYVIAGLLLRLSAVDD